MYHELIFVNQFNIPFLFKRSAWFQIKQPHSSWEIKKQKDFLKFRPDLIDFLNRALNILYKSFNISIFFYWIDWKNKKSSWFNQLFITNKTKHNSISGMSPKFPHLLVRSTTKYIFESRKILLAMDFCGFSGVAKISFWYHFHNKDLSIYEACHYYLHQLGFDQRISIEFCGLIV